jgi:RNA polymerase sigma factor (sigma-70 family)
MAPFDRLARLDTVARRLTFAIDDHDAANAMYARWRASRDDRRPDTRALEQIEVWAYCYVQRHALVRFAREPRLGGSADLDALISATFLHVRTHLGDVRDVTRFSHWVAVACRNGFVTYCRRRALRPQLEAASESLAELPEDAPDEALELDRALVHRVVRAAVARLPETLRTVAEMRLIEGRPYDDIAYTTGHPQPTVRAYVSKAVSRLRADPDLRALQEELAGSAPAPARRA